MSLDVDLRSLLKRMNKTTARAVNTAVGASSSRSHYELTPDHMLVALLDDPGSDVPRILKRFEIDEARVRRMVNRSLESMRAGNPGKPSFSTKLLDWLQAAWLHSSVDLGQAEIRSGGMMLALAANPGRFLSQDYLELLSPIGRDTLRVEFDAIVLGSAEQSPGAVGGAASYDEATTGGKGKTSGKRPADSALARYTVDFTAQARAGKIDPVFGRDREIRQMVDILGRRRKNNPIVVGEAGVGKTAVVEGLALRVVQGDVPEVLQGVDILALDLGLLQAGAGVRGEFENRLKSVIDEVKGSEVPIILFIDEAHTLIGAGGSQGGSDAANLLKPALARGELRTIAATTWAEYKKYFETDAALSRRFQPVKLDEPGEEDAIVMLRGLKSHYEASHKVIIRDDGVVAAVRFSNRYIAGRQLPDKAVDLLDTCAARVKVAQAARPARLEDLVKRREALERERDAVGRDERTGCAPDAPRMTRLAEDLAKISEETTAIETAWNREREAAGVVMEARKALEDKPADEAARVRLDQAMMTLASTRDGQSYVPLEVDPETVAKTVSDWTGIPLGNMVRDQAKAILEFETRLRGRIKGQDHALESVGRGLRAAKAGIGNPSAPMGVFMFVGPSGVGKTETALGIAELLFGGERFLTSVNMSEYQEKHTVSLLKGSPPGYVGYGEGGVLTEPVRQRPYSVVLLDEVEKAHPDVMNLFYQVFDKGTLTDGTGRDIDFKNTIIVLTSNLGTDVITRMCGTPVAPDIAELTAAVKPALVQHFKPALNARWTIVPFLTIGQDVMKDIVRLKLDRVGRRLMEAHRIALAYDQAVVDQIASRCTEVDTGARNVDHVVQAALLPRISTEILLRMTSGDMPQRLHLGIASDGSFDLRWGGAAEQPGAAPTPPSSEGPLTMPKGVPFVEPNRPAEA